MFMIFSFYNGVSNWCVGTLAVAYDFDMKCQKMDRNTIEVRSGLYIAVDLI
jgi:hypothetical protein